MAGGAASRRRKPTRRISPSARPSEHGFSRPTAPVVREVQISETISVADLAKQMAVKAGEVIKVLMGMGNLPQDKQRSFMADIPQSASQYLQQMIQQLQRQQQRRPR